MYLEMEIDGKIVELWDVHSWNVGDNILWVFFNSPVFMGIISCGYIKFEEIKFISSFSDGKVKNSKEILDMFN